MAQGRDRVYFLVSHDLDPIPGTNDCSKDALDYQNTLQSHLSAYDPQVQLLGKIGMCSFHDDLLVDDRLCKLPDEDVVWFPKPEEVAIGDDRYTDPATA